MAGNSYGGHKAQPKYLLELVTQLAPKS